MIFSGLILLSLITTEVPAKITYLVGNVIVERGGKKYAGVLNAQLYVNDIVTTYRESVCEIQFADYSLVRIEPNSSIRIEKKEKVEKKFYQRIFATIGEVITKVAKLNKGDEIVVKTEAAQAYIRGTIFKTTVDQEGRSSFSVFAGKIRVKSLVEGAKEFFVDKNFSARIGKGELKPLVEKLPLDEIKLFAEKYKDFLDRGKILDSLRQKAEQEIKEKKEELIEEGKRKIKGCIF
ncbi:MAG: FecR domain-containing protein [candidate division WOR-3 bacterium]